MKKGFLFLFLFFAIVNIAVHAQVWHPHVSADSKITIEEAGDLTNNFYLNNERNYPIAFLINVTTNGFFYNYLTAHDFEFLHVYFMKDNASNYLLGITGADIEHPSFKRINMDSTSGGTSYMFATTSYPLFTTSQFPCNTKTDANLDAGNRPASVYALPAEYILPATDPLGTHIDATTYIKNFQNENFGKPYTSSSWYPQSFLIRADRLINDFIMNLKNLQALQIYIGKDMRPTNLTQSQQVKLVIVGLDKNGAHIYYSENNIDYVFEEILPCPVCGVELDNSYEAMVLPPSVSNSTDLLIDWYKAWEPSLNKNEIEKWLQLKR